ncbi:hypothetical protein EVAR_136_1 [Eumeta japonica]|uniref:Uncharacterized protein n=1 Tax=Eumeta variegata TaxID=151549 RepID=A0A4C1SBV4_EUMVA|nr:hypothetical protein EVAR_136_1 [Eumeta japonica]
MQVQTQMMLFDPKSIIEINCYLSTHYTTTAACAPEQARTRRPQSKNHSTYKNSSSCNPDVTFRSAMRFLQLFFKENRAFPHGHTVCDYNQATKRP